MKTAQDIIDDHIDKNEDIYKDDTTPETWADICTILVVGSEYFVDLVENGNIVKWEFIKTDF